jgi:hypothetical protein
LVLIEFFSLYAVGLGLSVAAVSLGGHLG